MFRMILNYQQHSPASYGREVAKSDFSFGLSKCFFQLFLEIETPANPHGMRFRGLVNKINACEIKLFFHFFLGVRVSLRESLFSERRNPRRSEKPNRNQIKMKYLPTLDLWNNATQQAVLTGQIKLQCGQWVKCGNSKPSRFVKTTGRSLWVAHPQGTPAATRERFLNLVSFASR